MLAEDVGSGMETMGRDSFAIPRISILQALSPEVNKNGNEYVEGAEVGMIYDGVSGTLYDGQEGILCLMISYRHTHINWWPRNSKDGKGFIADLGPDPNCLKATKKGEKALYELPNRSEIVPTHEYFTFIIDRDDDNAISRALIPMAKTQYKKAKQLNTLAQLMIPVAGTKKPAPLFYRTYLLTVVPESNDKGNWMGWKIDPGPCLLDNDLGLEVLAGGEAIYLEARAFKDSVAKGEVKVEAPKVESDHVDGGGASRNRDDSAPM